MPVVHFDVAGEEALLGAFARLGQRVVRVHAVEAELGDTEYVVVRVDRMKDKAAGRARVLRSVTAGDDLVERSSGRRGECRRGPVHLERPGAEACEPAPEAQAVLGALLRGLLWQAVVERVTAGLHGRVVHTSER